MNKILVWCKCGKVKAAYNKDRINNPDIQREIKYYKNHGFKVSFGNYDQDGKNFDCECKNKKI